MPVIDLQDVEVYYGAFKALNGVTCTIDERSSASRLPSSPCAPNDCPALGRCDREGIQPRSNPEFVNG